MEEKIKLQMDDELAKAWRALSGYKFYMFGYHASAWVKLNRLLEKPLPNPFKILVHVARVGAKEGKEGWIRIWEKNYFV